jgi:hypothetical protein
MPVESRLTRHSKESALIRKDDVGHGPISELEETVEIFKSGSARGMRLLTLILVKH